MTTSNSKTAHASWKTTSKQADGQCAIDHKLTAKKHFMRQWSLLQSKQTVSTSLFTTWKQRESQCVFVSYRYKCIQRPNLGISGKWANTFVVTMNFTPNILVHEWIRLRVILTPKCVIHIPLFKWHVEQLDRAVPAQEIFKNRHTPLCDRNDRERFMKSSITNEIIVSQSRKESCPTK